MKTIKELKKDIVLIKTSSQAQHSKIKEVLKNMLDILEELEELIKPLKTASIQPESKISPALANVLKKESKNGNE